MEVKWNWYLRYLFICYNIDIFLYIDDSYFGTPLDYHACFVFGVLNCSISILKLDLVLQKQKYD